jgi:molybdopterin/thiamine biosynthesis adenylyltransferase
MTTDISRSSRQTFLGDDAPLRIDQAHVAVLGLGGGGSHIVQQLAHVGFRRFTICDPDVVEDTNLNRLIGATLADVTAKERKVNVAARMVRGLCADALLAPIDGRWEDHAELLRRVDIICGCLDGYGQRQRLEEFTRRYMIPLVDIGLHVHCVASHPPAMSGQVILSMPGGPCMTCLGYLNPVALAREGERYGDAGVRPQVVWANGALASAAVGIVGDLIAGWTDAPPPIYLEYDGNAQTLVPPQRLKYVKVPCPHFPTDQIDTCGDPVFR